MMSPQDLLDHLMTEPFEPFRIHFASGRDFDIRYPESAQVGRTTLSVYAPPDGDPSGPHRWERIMLALVESIDPLERLPRNYGRRQTDNP